MLGVWAEGHNLSQYCPFTCLVMPKIRSGDYGHGVVELSDEAVSNVALDTQQLLRRLADPGFQPPVLPSIAIELLSLSRKPSIGIRDIALLLERDPVLTADMLRLVQSAAMRGTSPIRTIDEALVRLGLRRASELFFRAAMESRLFKCGGAEAVFERLRKHCVATAELSRLVCRQTSLFDDSAYLCGLLHDVGIAGCLLAIGCARNSNPEQEFRRIWPAIRGAQSKFALHVAVLWDLPEELRLVLSHHLEFGRRVPSHPLAAVTYLAEQLASRYGAAFEDENDAQYLDQAIQSLRLTPTHLTQLERIAEEHVTQTVCARA